MADPFVTKGATAAQSIAPASLGSATRSRSAEESGGVAFRALLERLEQDARTLEHDAKHIEGATALAGAVDRAHASLQDALSLGDQLLEAYRQALAQPPPANASGNPVRGS